MHYCQAAADRRNSDETNQYKCPDHPEKLIKTIIVIDVKFFLHARGIEAVDYTDEHRNWFDRMPGKKNETLRPALVMDDVLLKKGLASGGR